MMDLAVKPDLKSKTFPISKSYTLLKEKEIQLVDFKFYQKLFIVFISLSTFLIFPETPKEIENICESYNSKDSCNIW
tara:strand:+ start:367 stop:597 length:231 start_codon:yes stop_codon:yes gene_type:complete